MFTGLIQGIGSVVGVEDRGTGRGLTLAIPEMLAVGESVALNGVCCTILPGESLSSGPTYGVDLLQETCDKTTLKSLQLGDVVNYERCVTPSTLLGGHLLQGHVDCTGVIQDIIALGNGTYALQIAYPEAFFSLLVPKGSIAIEGISLTVVDVTPMFFSVHIIPHTWHMTVLSHRKIGDLVNLEYDIVGKYLYHFYTIHHRNT